MSQGCSPPDPVLAYVAGLIDGEGHIGITKSHGKYFSVEVTVGMAVKALPLLRQLEQQFGGSIHKSRNATEQWSEAWKWRIGGASARRFLEQIEPYLFLKRPQAKIAMALPTGRPWTAEKEREAAQLKDEMRKANMKGPSAPDADAALYEMSPDIFGTWQKFSGKFPRWGMWADGVFSELPTPERRTVATDSGSWPTPMSVPESKASHGQLSGRFREAMAQEIARRQWPTPTAHNAKECAAPSEFNRNTPTLAAQASGGPQTQPMTLNPVWVEWLMGWPAEWTALKPLATARFQPWWRSHGGRSHE